VLDERSDRNRLATLPVVVLSAGGQPFQVPEADKFVRKPADPNVLLGFARKHRAASGSGARLLRRAVNDKAVRGARCAFSLASASSKA
jgi:hypothetical protein